MEHWRTDFCLLRFSAAQLGFARLVEAKYSLCFHVGENVECTTRRYNDGGNPCLLRRSHSRDLSDCNGRQYRTNHQHHRLVIYVNPDAFFSQMKHWIYDPHANQGVQGVWGRSPQLAFTTIYHQRGSGGGAPSKL